MDNEVFNSIIAEYDVLRAKAKRERDSRVASVYERVPEIKEIDKKIAQIGSSTLRAILTDPDNKNAKDDMKSKFRILSQRRSELLKAENIPEDFDKIQYKCKKCNDTGYEEGVGRCSCFRQKIIQRVIGDLYKRSNMSELLERQNFDTFRLDVYSKEKAAGYSKTPYDNMRNIKRYCEDFAEHFDEKKKSLVFYGDTGLGKTFMSSCIAKYLMDRERTVTYLRASKLFKMFDDERFGRLSGGMDEIYKSDLLIIDDLGAEAEYRNNSSYLLELIDERIMNGKKIIINTNLNFEMLEKRYSKRFSSRILESFNMIYFFGEDIRRKKLFGRA